MKNLFLTLLTISIASLFVVSCKQGFEKEIQRQCIVAMDICEKYADTGACEPKYMKVCDGVEI